MEEWKTFKLGDILQIKYGKDHKALADGPFPAFGSGGIMRSVEKPIYNKQSILIPRKGSLNNIVYVDSPFWTVDTMFWTIIDTSIVLPHFLFYELKDYDFASLNVGSAVPSLTCPVIEAIEVSIPSLQRQRQILDCLEPIDNKITLNTRINHNLEEQIKQLYNHWFIDNGDIEYQVVPLSEMIYFQEGPGIRNWQYVEKDGTKFINIRCITDGDVNLETANMISTEEANGKYHHFLLKEGDIVMSCSGTLGRYAIIRKEHLPLCLNTSVIRFSPKISESDYSFVYGYLSSDEFLNIQKDLACGSVQANFGPSHLKSMNMRKYPVDYRARFDKIVRPMVRSICHNRSETVELMKERDYLIPRLMSVSLS